MTERIGVIGLGLMGTAISERLLEHGHEVIVHNRTRSKAEPLEARGAVWSDNPLRECRRVIICLYTTDVVEDVLRRLEDGLTPGRTLIDTTTGDPERTAALGERLARREVRYLEAPVSGSSEQTRRGEVTALVGGPVETFEACRDLLEQMARAVFHVGPWGSAARMKLVSNLVLGLNRAALAEGLAFAEAIGLEKAGTLQVLMGSMAGSRIMETKGSKMVEGDFSTQARLSQHLKDVRLMEQAASAAGLSLPLTGAHRKLLEEVEQAGFGDEDNSALIRAYGLSRKAGED